MPCRYLLSEISFEGAMRGERGVTGGRLLALSLDSNSQGGSWVLGDAEASVVWGAVAALGGAYEGLAYSISPAGAAACREVPQNLQNVLSGGLSLLQAGQAILGTGSSR
jgi:hypothetical protein